MRRLKKRQPLGHRQKRALTAAKAGKWVYYDAKHWSTRIVLESLENRGLIVLDDKRFKLVPRPDLFRV